MISFLRRSLYTRGKRCGTSVCTFNVPPIMGGMFLQHARFPVPILHHLMANTSVLASWMVQHVFRGPDLAFIEISTCNSFGICCKPEAVVVLAPKELVLCCVFRRCLTNDESCVLRS
jgi:hypothetical protein